MRRQCTGWGLSFLVVSLLTTPALAEPQHVFLPPVSFESGLSLATCAIGDVTGDGKNDVVALGSIGSAKRVYVFAQDATGSLMPSTFYDIGGFVGVYESIGIGDLTGDGRADVVAVLGPGIAVLPQTATGTLGTPVPYTSTTRTLLRVADLNNDTRLDVVCLTGNDAVDVFYQSSAGTLAAAVSYPVGHGGADDLDTGDVNGDGRTDIIVMSGQGNLYDNMGALLQTSNGFSTPVYLRVDSNNADGLGVGDVTGDGRADVMIAVSFVRQFAVVPQSAAGTLGMPIFYDINSQSFAGIDVADVTRDGLADALIATQGSIHPYLQQPDGTLIAAPAEVGVTIAGRHGFATGDVNSDGRLDVATTGGSSGLNVLYGTAAEVSVELSDDPDRVLATLPTRITAVVRNQGPDEARDVVASFVLPTGLNASSFVPSQGECDYNAMCALGNIAAGTSATITFDATSDDEGVYETRVSVSAYNFDPVESNNVDSEETTVLPAADLAVGAAVGYEDDGTVAGSIIFVSNHGPDDAIGTTLRVTLSEGLVYAGSEVHGIAGELVGSCDVSGTEVVCPLGNLPKTDLFSTPKSPEISVTLRGSGHLEASVGSDTGDPDPTNNVSTLDFGEPGTAGGLGDPLLPPAGGGDSGGCGCHLVARRTSFWVWLAGALAALVAIRRRR
jgi:hypothetical protein